MNTKTKKLIKGLKSFIKENPENEKAKSFLNEVLKKQDNKDKKDKYENSKKNN